MKKFLIFALITVFLLVFGFFYIFKLSPRARNAWRNVENSKKIKVGMTVSEVNLIMGSPYSARKSWENKTDSIFYYEPPFGASDGIRIYVDENRKVSRVTPYR